MAKVFAQTKDGLRIQGTGTIGSCSFHFYLSSNASPYPVSPPQETPGIFLKLELTSSTGFPCTCMHARLLQSCPTFCDLMDCSPPGDSVHRILQAGKLEWVAMPGDLPHPGIKLESLMWQADSLSLSHLGSPAFCVDQSKTCSLCQGLKDLIPSHSALDLLVQQKPLWSSSDTHHTLLPQDL